MKPWASLNRRELPSTDDIILDCAKFAIDALEGECAKAKLKFRSGHYLKFGRLMLMSNNMSCIMRALPL